MKKLFSLLFLAGFAHTMYAQTAAVSLVTTPCHNDGVLSVGFTGLTPPLTVKWITVGTSATTIVHTGVSGLADILTGYSGGFITVIAYDGVDSAITTFTGAPPFTYIDSSTSAVCPGLGKDTIIVFGGTAPYTYYWYNKATMAAVGTSAALHAPAGNYGCTITDATGCTFGSTVNNDFISITTTAPFYDSLLSTVASCTNGTATAAPTGGGTAPFSYLWSNGATTPFISGLVKGTYTVTITDADGCSSVGDVDVAQSVFITAPVTPTPATCLASDGAVIAFGSGGVPPYSFVWSNGATTQSQTGLHGGFYNVTVTDANGCIGDGSTFVSTSTPITATYVSTPSLCISPTGTTTLTLSGGTTPYTIQWGTFPVQTSITATALTYGTYDFTVTDAVGCVQRGTVIVPPVDVISLSYTAVPALCTLSTGGLTAFPTGGVAPYTYLWSTGATTSGITAKPAGLYQITVTDNLGCKLKKDVYLPNTSPIGAGLFSTPASCIFTSDGKDSVNVWGGTPPYHYNWTNGGTTRTISGLPTGPYLVTVSDAAGCTISPQYSYVGYDTAGTTCYCTIDGTVFADYNNNCVQDFGEPGIPNIQIGVSGRGYTYTNAAGHYAMKVPAGSYTVSETVLAFYPLASCQSNNISVTVAGGGCTVSQDFANAIDTIHDMHISTWDYLYNAPVVGHSYTQVSIVSNDGTVAEDSILIGYKTDGKLLSPSFVPGGVFSGTPYHYTTAAPFVTLAPGANQQYLMTYSVPTNIPINTVVVTKDTVSFKGDLSNWLADYSPWNNTTNVSTITRSSYDPNFKEVLPKGTGSAGTITYSDSVLEYMVHFQNTGTYMAENITVIDTLDDNLDWTTMRPVYQSANCQVTLTQMGTKKVAKFIFNDINLPAQKDDDLRSNGMFTYTIHLKRRLAVGTQIRNNASIYFDYNAPVKTNTTLNTIGSPDPYTSVEQVVAGSCVFSVFPNPANNVFAATINSANTGSATIEVADVTGRVQISKTVNMQKGIQSLQIDVAKLASGTYFVSYTNNGIKETQKLVIMK